MKTYHLTLPLIGLLAGTRALAGAGLALLMADKLDTEQRKAVGWALLLTGIVTTGPLAAQLFHHSAEER